jgi:prolyl-tRNA editing enzyme YbaK/EbsC (Cys-tRNA(Pro) deacylase)
MLPDGAILVIAAGDAKVDNRKFKEKFHAKAKMLDRAVVEEIIGHAVGGVCPFGVNEGVRVYLDKSLLRFDTVYPAAGTANSAVRLSPDELYLASEALEWVEVTTVP